jgi:hypothetical protein
MIVPQIGRIARSLTLAGCLVALAAPALAVDGVVLINQDRALAGNVTPGDPPGFPVRITRSGSYRLSSNLTVPDPDTTAISVTVNDVTIDLNGFRIKGPTSCSGTPLTCSSPGVGRGINAENRRNVAVTNGAIVGMGETAIVTGPEARIDRVAARSNGGQGVFAGPDSVVTNSTAARNGGSGIIASNGSTVTASTASENAQYGVFVGTGATVTASAARGNGIGGIGSTSGAAIVASATTANASVGISAGSGSTLFANAASLNLKDGIRTGQGATVMANTASENAGTGDFDSGITAGDGSTLFANTARDNGALGINGIDNSTVFGNTVTGNDGDGIRTFGGLVFGNTVANNQSAFGLTSDSGTAFNVVNDNTGGNFAGGTAIHKSLCATTLCPP